MVQLQFLYAVGFITIIAVLALGVYDCWVNPN